MTTWTCIINLTDHQAVLRNGRGGTSPAGCRPWWLHRPRTSYLPRVAFRGLHRMKLPVLGGTGRLGVNWLVRAWHVDIT